MPRQAEGEGALSRRRRGKGLSEQYLNVRINHRSDHLVNAIISISDSAWANERAVQRLPTVELQLHAWMRLVDAGGIRRSVDLRRGGYKLYVRRSIRALPGIGTDAGVLDIASVDLSPRLRSKRWFSGFLELADALNPWDATYVECVHNPRLAAYLARSGYAMDAERCYYRPSQKRRLSASVS